VELATLRGHVRLQYAERINAPAASVWSQVADFGGTSLVAGYVDRVEAIGSGIGMQRIFHANPTVATGSVVEELVAIDHRRMTMSYEMIDNGPVPWTGYKGTMTVTPSGEQSAIVHGTSEFVPLLDDPKDLVQLSQRNFYLFFRNLTRAVLAEPLFHPAVETAAQFSSDPNLLEH
jgi:hypothetical protein